MSHDDLCHRALDVFKAYHMLPGDSLGLNEFIAHGSKLGFHEDEMIQGLGIGTELGWFAIRDENYFEVFLTEVGFSIANKRGAKRDR